MNRTYPGFHQWWQQRQPQHDPREQARLPLELWPEQRTPQQVPATPDPLDYGRVALQW